MRHRLIAVLGTAVAVGVADSAAAQPRPDFRIGPQLSFANDADFGIGGRVEVGVPASNVFVTGSFDLFFPPGNNVDYWELNGNLGYQFPLTSTSDVVPYVAGGLNLAHASVPAGSNTDVGLNLLGGGRFPLQAVSLFFELRFEVKGGEQVVITGGVLF